MTKPKMPANFKEQLDAIFVSAKIRRLTLKEFAIEIWKYMWGIFTISYLHILIESVTGLEPKAIVTAFSDVMRYDR